MTYIRATLGNNVLEGEGQRVGICGWRIKVAKNYFLNLYETSGWKVEEIPEPVKLPTKRNAIIEVTPGTAEHYWLVGAGVWHNRDGDGLQAEHLVQYIMEENAGFRVVFEGED